MNFYPIFWREMLAWKHDFNKILISSLIGPLLYLVTFGWGLGRRMPMEGVNYLDFVVPGIIALAALSNSYGAISADLNIRRTLLKTFDQYVMAPLTIGELVLGEVLAGALRGLFSCALIIILGYLFGAQFQLSWLFFLVLAVSCFAFSSLGVIAALANDSHRDMATFSSLFIVPMSFLAGTFFRIDALPGLVKYIIWLLPLTPTSHTLRSLALGQGLEMWALAGVFFWALVMFSGALVVTKMKYAD